MTDYTDAQMLYMVCLALEEGLDGITHAEDLNVLLVKMIGEHWRTADEDSSSEEAHAAFAQLEPYIPDHLRAAVPTDDEREAAALHLWDEGLVRPESLARSVIDSLISEGWHLHRTVQGESSDAAVKAAARAFFESVHGPLILPLRIDEESRRAWTAALRAAAATAIPHDEHAERQGEPADAAVKEREAVRRIQAWLDSNPYLGDKFKSDLRLTLRAASATDAPALIDCPHWAPGRITLRQGCTACEASAAVTEGGER
jgi:hypothetical protein